MLNEFLECYWNQSLLGVGDDYIRVEIRVDYEDSPDDQPTSSSQYYWVFV